MSGPQDLATGSASLPMARVRKTIRLDDDIDACTPTSTFLVAVATEMFVGFLVEQAHHSAKAEKKPRRHLQYKDLANIVARMDSLEFLNDVIPKTVPYNQLLEKTGGANEQPR